MHFTVIIYNYIETGWLSWTISPATSVWEPALFALFSIQTVCVTDIVRCRNLTTAVKIIQFSFPPMTKSTAAVTLEITGFETETWPVTGLCPYGHHRLVLYNIFLSMYVYDQMAGMQTPLSCQSFTRDMHKMHTDWELHLILLLCTQTGIVCQPSITDWNEQMNNRSQVWHVVQKLL